MKVLPYDLIVPLGEWCGAALWTRRLGMRSCSLPLDWMLARDISLGGYAKLVCEDFRSFMLKENLSLLPAEGLNPDAPADCYLDAASGLVSVHDFRRGVPFEEAYPVFRQKFERRIRRLYARIGTAKRVLFLHLARKGCPSPEMARTALATLRARFVGCRIELLVIIQDNACGRPVMTQDDGLFLGVGTLFPARWRQTLGEPSAGPFGSATLPAEGTVAESSVPAVGRAAVSSADHVPPAFGRPACGARTAEKGPRRRSVTAIEAVLSARKERTPW